MTVQTKTLITGLTAGLVLACLVTVPHGYLSFHPTKHIYGWALFLSEWAYHLLIAFAVVFFAVYEKKRRDGSFVSTLLAMLLIAATVNIIKYTPFGHLTPRPSGYQGGFPSGHTATSFAIAYFVSLKMPKLSLPMFLIAAAVGFSRLFAGSEFAAHYPYQIISGSLFGTYLAWGADLFRARKREKNKLS